MEEDKKEMKEEELKEVSGGMKVYYREYCPNCKKYVGMEDLVCPYCGQPAKQ